MANGTAYQPSRALLAVARDLADLALVRTAAPDFGPQDYHREGRYVVPATKITLLTVTSKMPSKSWSLPAHSSCPFAYTLDPDAICSHCYASKGAYVWNLTQRAQWARFYWTQGCIRSEFMRDRWVEVMAAAVLADGERQLKAILPSAQRLLAYNGTPARGYFRWHDSGDLFSPAYTEMVARVCAATPNVHHWIPTRSYRGPWLATIARLAALPNVTVRPSALVIGQDAPTIAGLQAGSGVKKIGFNCPAPTQNNECGQCRACWDSPAVPIYYRAH